MHYLSEVVEGSPGTVIKYVKRITKQKICGKGEHCSCDSCKAIESGVSLHCCEFGTGEGISIYDVRKAGFILSRKVAKYRAIVFKAYSGISEKCSNSLLKVLEEPPENSQLFVGVKSQWVLPSTVLSRCSIKQLEVLVSGESFQAISGVDLEKKTGS